jgi:hypothetical protein
VVTDLKHLYVKPIKVVDLVYTVKNVVTHTEQLIYVLLHKPKIQVQQPKIKLAQPLMRTDIQAMVEQLLILLLEYKIQVQQDMDIMDNKILMEQEPPQ